MDSIQVLNLDLEGTDFSGIGAGWRGVPWDATANWRQAKFDDAVRAEMEAKYGSEAPAIRVLMLMWEAPPLVAGGTWTACYHLVRNLRRRGADVTVVVPWDRAALLPNPFGVDVPIVALGITPPDAAGSVYGGGAQGWSPYGGSSISGYAGWSGYGAAAPFWSTYARHGGPSAYGSVYGAYASGGGSATGATLSGSILYRLIGGIPAPAGSPRPRPSTRSHPCPRLGHVRRGTRRRWLDSLDRAFPFDRVRPPARLPKTT